jgi:hypothetical protein
LFSEDANFIDEEIDVLVHDRCLLLETLLGESVVQETTETSMLAGNSVHDGHGSILALWHTARVTRPLLLAFTDTVDIVPGLLASEGELVGRNADGVTVLEMDLGDIILETTAQLPAIL